MVKLATIFLLLLVGNDGACFGQSFLVFRKNGHREAHYYVGDVLSFSVKGEKAKVVDQIRGFEDSLIIFQYYKLNVRDVNYLYVDNKTKIWYITRYKYDKLFPLLGAGLISLDVINTGKIQKKAVLIGVGFISVGLLAKWIISKKMQIKGNRKLVIVSG